MRVDKLLWVGAMFQSGAVKPENFLKFKTIVRGEQVLSLGE